MSARRVHIDFVDDTLAFSLPTLDIKLDLVTGRSSSARLQARYRFLKTHGIKTHPGGIVSRRAVERALAT